VCWAGIGEEEPGTLQPLSKMSSWSAHPAHLDLHRSAGTLAFPLALEVFQLG
jgi:hypothetical protein